MAKKVLIYEIARILEVFRINIARDISKFTKMSRELPQQVIFSFEISLVNIYPKYPDKTVLFPVYTTRQRNFPFYLTHIILSSHVQMNRFYNNI